MDAGYAYHAELIQRHIELVPAYATLQQSVADDVDVGPDTLREVLAAAAQFAQERLAPLNLNGDRQGCRLVNGRVLTPTGYPQVWRELAAAGWNAVDQPTVYGGQGLPSFVNAACRELFDRACMAIGMISGPSRAATLVLLEFADASLRDEWVPHFVAGDWSATLGISEADAGSDVGRIRTRAVQDPEGGWRITGEKMWTSFGDNDIVERIGHLVLARTPDAPPGSAGLSLFLVPNLLRNAQGGWTANGVVVRRIEEKLGLHGSPTCAMGFENAQAHLIGQINRGLPQMFVMIQGMRLMVALEGVGMAFGAEQTALKYAAERRQGGDAAQPPVLINTHPDIQRQLLAMASRVEVLRGLVYELAMRIDAERLNLTGGKVEATRHAKVTQWLLPIAKACCAEAGFDISHAAIQVLGGAGYTQEWPLEQWLRDARMMSIAEGSTGIQALDLLHRRLWRDGGEGLDAFVEAAMSDIEQADPATARPAKAVIASLQRVCVQLLARRDDPQQAEPGAVSFLQLAMLAATGWIAVRICVRATSDTPIDRRLVTAARYWLADIESAAVYHERQALAGAENLAAFDRLYADQQ